MYRSNHQVSVSASARSATRRATVAFALLLAAPASAQELSPRQIAAQARPGVVLVTAKDDSSTIGQGSGFLVSQDGVLVTNRHVVEGATNLQVELASGEIFDRVLFVSEDERRDLVVLRIPGSGLSPLVIGDDRSVEVGDPVYVMGNPLGLEGTFSDGLVSARRVLDGVALIQITAPISPGSSGGPVLDHSGRVIGVATLSMREGQNLNLAVPARYASGLVALDESAQPFERVAGRFTSGAARTSTAAGGEGEADDLPPWADALIDELEFIRDAVHEQGLVRTHDGVLQGLDEGDEHKFTWRYSERGRDIGVIGVCDLDCSDLDLTVRDPRGRVVARDVSVTDRPFVDFSVDRPGLYEVTVRMYSCDREPCFFAVQSFSTRR